MSDRLTLGDLVAVTLRSEVTEVLQCKGGRRIVHRREWDRPGLSETYSAKVVKRVADAHGAVATHVVAAALHWVAELRAMPGIKLTTTTTPDYCELLTVVAELPC